MKKYVILIGVLIFFSLSFIPVAFAQDDASLDDRFLNDSDDSVGPSDLNFSVSQEQKAKFDLLFSITEYYKHSVLHTNSVHNLDEINFISAFENILFLETIVNYKNAKRWFSFGINNRVFFSLQDKKNKMDMTDLHTFLSNELYFANLGFYVWEQQLSFRVGKILGNTSTSFLRSPSDPLFRSYGSAVAFASNRIFNNVYTRKRSKVDELEQGSGRSLGSVGISGNQIGHWMADVQLVMPWFTLRQAYLPKLETGFEEFDRPYHSSLTTFSLTYFPVVVPTLTFFYDNKPFVGFGLSANVGDHVTIHFDSGLSFKNELPMLRKDGNQNFDATTRVDHYKLEPYGQEGVYFESVIGATITPTYDSQALFSMLFELYYNGKGLLQDEWKNQINILKDIDLQHDTLRGTSLNAFSNVYRAMLSASLQYYDPLRVRPVYLSLQISRDDIFSKVWTQRFDLTSVLVYSPFDTTFAWKTNIDWIGKEIISVGSEVSYYFGMPEGAFTEIPSVFTFSIYMELSFLKI